MSRRHRANDEINRCRRLPRRCMILATSSTMLAMMRIEILKSNHRWHRSRRTSRSFYINQPVRHRTNHVCVSLLLQRFRRHSYIASFTSNGMEISACANRSRYQGPNNDRRGFEGATFTPSCSRTASSRTTSFSQPSKTEVPSHCSL
jgi:hypothetical protein